MTYLEDSCDCGQLNYSRPLGSPWSRTNYHYGQLLGVEDFQQEQQGLLNHRRLHNALLHGAGTVWGLNVQLHDQREATIMVKPGLAIDALGREIYIEEEQCLDVSQITREEIWSDLEELRFRRKKAKRGYVIIEFQNCLSNVVSAISPPCSDDSERTKHARINDYFFITLSKEAPDYPFDYQREWLDDVADPSHEDDWQSLRDRLVDFLVKDRSVELREMWTNKKKAPVLIAEVFFFYRNDEVKAIEINNRVRSLLPSVQLCAEQVLGQRLMGRDKREFLKVVSLRAAEGSDPQKKMEIQIQTNVPANGLTVAGGSVEVNTIKGNTAWQAETVASPVVSGSTITVPIETTVVWEDGVVYQVLLNGAGSQPIVSQRGAPLMGFWDEPVQGQGRGRDISVVRTWYQSS